MPRKRKSYIAKKNSIWNNNHSDPNSINLSTSSSSVDMTNHRNIKNSSSDNDMSNNHAASRSNNLFSDVDMEISNDIDQCIRDYSKKKLSKSRTNRSNVRNKPPINLSYDLKNTLPPIKQHRQLSYNSNGNTDSIICEHLQTCESCKNTIYQCLDSNVIPQTNLSTHKRKTKRQRTQLQDRKNHSSSNLSDDSNSESDDSSVINLPSVKRKKVARKNSKIKKTKSKHNYRKSTSENDSENSEIDVNNVDSLSNNGFCTIL